MTIFATLQHAQICFKGMTNNVGFTFSVGDITQVFAISVEQTNRNGDTEYNF